MPKRTASLNKMTDNQLAQLYLGLARDYTELSAQGLDATQIYNALYNRLYHSLHNPASSLCGLSEPEQLKAKKVLDTFFNACPAYQGLETERRIMFYQQPQLVTIYHRDDCVAHHDYCHDADGLFTWMMLSSMMPAHGHQHGHHSENNKALKYFFAILFIGFIALSALIAFYYMLSTFLNSVERFVYDEGWFRAGLNIAGILAGAAAGSCIGIYLAAIPLIFLGIGLGLSNPVGLAIGGAVCLAVIGAALTCAFTNWVYPDDKNALDPKDAYRFAVTDAEAEHMMDNGIDPIKVKCAITALRQQMGKNEVPSLLNRLFTQRGGEKQKLLQQVRQLRRGELSEIDVNGLHFDLESPEYASKELDEDFSLTATTRLPG